RLPPANCPIRVFIHSGADTFARTARGRPLNPSLHLLQLPVQPVDGAIKPPDNATLALDLIAEHFLPGELAKLPERPIALSEVAVELPDLLWRHRRQLGDQRRVPARRELPEQRVADRHSV